MLSGKKNSQKLRYELIINISFKFLYLFVESKLLTIEQYKNLTKEIDINEKEIRKALADDKYYDQIVNDTISRIKTIIVRIESLENLDTDIEIQKKLNHLKQSVSELEKDYREMRKEMDFQ